MTAHPHLRTLAVCALVAFGGQSASASSGGQADRWRNAIFGSSISAAVRSDETTEPERYAQADCSAAAAQAAAQTGGQVLSVSASSQGGQTVCVVTVLIPGQGGERPRRTTVTIPG